MATHCHLWPLIATYCHSWPLIDCPSNYQHINTTNKSNTFIVVHPKTTTCQCRMFVYNSNGGADGIVGISFGHPWNTWTTAGNPPCSNDRFMTRSSQSIVLQSTFAQASWKYRWKTQIQKDYLVYWCIERFTKLWEICDNIQWQSQIWYEPSTNTQKHIIRQ